MAKNSTVVAPVVKVRGGKSGKTRERRGFWDRALQAPKVREALATLNVDEKAFEKAYNATRKARERGEITDAQKAAILKFAEHRNIHTFAQEIGKSTLTASVLLGRAMEAKLI